MAHFGLVCPPITGHIEPLAALGRALIRRGHRATFFHIQDVESKAGDAGLEFCPIGTAEYPAGTLASSVQQLSQLSGLASLRFAVQSACRISEVILKDGPEAMGDAKLDLVLVDQNEPAAGSVAEHLKIPFVSVCTSLPLNREPLIPPPFVGWDYQDAAWAAARNNVGYLISDRMIAPIQATLNKYRGRWGLREVRKPDDTFSQLAQLAQMPQEFDFPRTKLPVGFQYFGPWFDENTSGDIHFPWDKLNGKSLIYGSVGTIQDVDNHHFQVIAQACECLDVQLVLSLGKRDVVNVPHFPGNTITVGYLPQLKILSRSALTITHAGLNTTQQSLFFGVPLIAVPLAHDQPAIAARLRRTGAGLVIAPKKLTAPALTEAIRKVLPASSSFRSSAERLQTAIKESGGAEAAADVVEQVATKQKKER